MPTAYDHLLEDTFGAPDMSPTEGMPPWQSGCALPRARQAVLDRLQKQRGSAGWGHLVMLDRFWGMDSHWVCEEFRFRTYGSLGLVEINVFLPVSGNDSQTLIWTSSSGGGWRDGVWWDRLEEITTLFEKTTLRLNGEKTRREEAEAKTRKAAADGAYSAYMRKVKAV